MRLGIFWIPSATCFPSKVEAGMQEERASEASSRGCRSRSTFGQARSYGIMPGLQALHGLDMAFGHHIVSKYEHYQPTFLSYVTPRCRFPNWQRHATHIESLRNQPQSTSAEIAHCTLSGTSSQCTLQIALLWRGNGKSIASVEGTSLRTIDRKKQPLTVLRRNRRR